MYVRDISKVQAKNGNCSNQNPNPVPKPRDNISCFLYTHLTQYLCLTFMTLNVSKLDRRLIVDPWIRNIFKEFCEDVYREIGKTYCKNFVITDENLLLEAVQSAPMLLLRRFSLLLKDLNIFLDFLSLQLVLCLVTAINSLSTHHP